MAQKWKLSMPSASRWYIILGIAMQNGPFVDDLPSKHGAGFPQLDYRRVCANHVNGILQYILSD
jgi:hypothetical protein